MLSWFRPKKSADTPPPPSAAPPGICFLVQVQDGQVNAFFQWPTPVSPEEEERLVQQLVEMLARLLSGDYNESLLRRLIETGFLIGSPGVGQKAASRLSGVLEQVRASSSSGPEVLVPRPTKVFIKHD